MDIGSLYSDYLTSTATKATNLERTLQGSHDKKSDDEPVDGQCSKEKPILKDNKCQVVYCTEKEYENGTCKKYNDYIKKQWLNNFHIFDDKF